MADRHVLQGDLDWLEFAIADYIAKWGEHLTGRPYDGNIAGIPCATANMAMTVIRKNIVGSWDEPSDNGHAIAPGSPDQNGSEWPTTTRCKRCGGSPVVAEVEGRTLVCATCRDDGEFRAHASKDYR